MPRPAEYQIVLHPPVYPAKCFPGRCDHDPKFVMVANVEIVKRKRGGGGIEIDHRVCLACGRSLDATHGGNVFVDLQMLWGKLGYQPQIGARIIALREKWARIAAYLFGPDGWNGRHERIARMIDPNLTMKLRTEPLSNGEHIGVVSFDNSYLRGA